MRPVYLVHMMEGRARLRHWAFADAEQQSRARDLLGREAGVLETRPGERSLLLILTPDADIAGICERLEAALPDLCRPDAEVRAERARNRKAARGGALKKSKGPAAGQKFCCGLSARKLEVRGMLGTLGLTLLMGLWGKGRAHLLTGSAFGLMAAQHIWQRRKTL